MATSAIPATAMRAIFNAVRLRGGVSRPARRLRASRSQNPVPAAPTSTASKIQPTTGSKCPLKMSSRTTSLVKRGLPMLTSDPPRTMIATPSRISSPPRVTMNDGIFSRATNHPWMAPNPEQASNATMIAAHHGQSAPLGCTSLATTTLLSAMTKPTERSISARSRAKISAIASTMYTVLCSKRLTRFCDDRNFEFAIWKLTATTTMARTTGRTPLSPLRTRSHQARRYWPSDWARSSGGTSAVATSGAAVRSTTVLVSAVPVEGSPEPAVTGVSGTGHAPAPGQHVNHYCGQEHAARQDVLQRRGVLTQVEKGHAVGNAADEQAAENTVECLTPAAEEAD